MAGALLSKIGDVQIGADISSTRPNQPVLCTRPTITRFGTWSDGTWVEDLNIMPGLEVETSDVPFFHRPGMRPGVDVAHGRKVELVLRLAYADPSDLRTQLDALMWHLRPTMSDPHFYPPSDSGSPTPTVQPEQELAFKTGSGTYVMFGRYRNFRARDMEWLGRGHVSIEVEFEATDPLIYETSTTTVELNKTTATIAHPIAFTTGQPTFPATGTPTTINPGGNGPARWSIEVTGPADNPAVFWLNESVVTGTDKVSFIGLGKDESTGKYVLTTGEKAVWDSALRIVSWPGFAVFLDRHITVGASWPELWPRATLIFAPNGVTSGGQDTSASTATITWRRGWWAVL